MVRSADRPPFLLGAATNWLAFAATLAVGFALTPLLVRTLGTPRYDAWCVTEAVLAYFTLLDLGVGVALVRAVARHRTDREAASRVASSCLAVFLVAGVVALAVGVPVVLALAPTLAAKAGDPGVPAFMLVMLANLAAALPLGVFPAVLDGLERFAAKSAVRVVFLALRTAGIVVVVRGGPDLLSLALVTTVSNLAEHAVMAVLCRRFLPGLRLSPRLVDRTTLRHIGGVSGHAFLAMLAGRVATQTGAVAVGLLLPAGGATAFVVAARLVESAKALLRTVTATLTPGVSAMDARGDAAGVRRLFLGTTKWVLYLAVPLNLGVWAVGRPFLVKWVGPDVAEQSYPAAAVLAATLAIGVAQSAASRVLYGLGRLRGFARLALAEAGLNLILTAALVGPFGVTGAAAAAAVPNLLFCAAVIALTTAVLGVTAKEYVAACGRPVLAGLVPGVVWVAMGTVQPTWGALAAALAAGVVPYAAVVVAFEVLPALTPVGSRALRVLRPSRRGSGTPCSGSCRR